MGKTFLLRQFASVAEQGHLTALYLDGRNIEPTSGGLLMALRTAVLAVNPDASVPEGNLVALWQALNTREKRCVILIDTYETLMPLDGWLREELLPNMPENVLLVLGGRQPPSSVWRADPVWNTLIRPLALRNLTPEETREFLAQRNIPQQQHDGVLHFTHGHPLALSLVADTFAQRGNVITSFSPEETPDVIKALLERFVQKVPSPAHRSALEACALVRMLTEGLLGQMLKMADAHELFEWLRELSFIDSGRSGIFPHDLAREAIAADVRWRNPDWYTELHKRARTYYNTRMQQVTGVEQQRVLFDFTFLHRDNAIVRQYIDWQESGSMRMEPARPADMAEIIKMIRAHEGETSAALAQHWFARQPEGVFAFRESNQVVGWLSRVNMESASEDDLKADPGAWKAWTYIRTHAPVRHGELATLFRFWVCHGYVSGHRPGAKPDVHQCGAGRPHHTAPGLHIICVRQPRFLGIAFGVCRPGTCERLRVGQRWTPLWVLLARLARYPTRAMVRADGRARDGAEPADLEPPQANCAGHRPERA